MVRKGIATAALLLLAFGAVGCDASASDGSQEDNVGGPGMTYNGKLGYDTGTGFVVPFDGSSPSLGYGF